MCVCIFLSFHLVDPASIFRGTKTYTLGDPQGRKHLSSSCVCVCVCVCMCVCAVVTQSCPTLCIPWTVAHQAPLSMELSRQEYWSGMPFPSSGDLLKLGIKPSILHCRQMLYHLSYWGSPFQFTWTPPNSSVLRPGSSLLLSLK